VPRPIALILFSLAIWGLFALSRDRTRRTGGALWLPVIWLALAASRSVTQWMEVFGLAGGISFTAEGQYVEGSPFDRAVYLALTVCGLVVLLARRRRLGNTLLANLPILLFFFYCGVSIFWSDFPDVALKRWIKALGDLVMVLVVLTDPDPVAAFKRLFSRVGLLLLPLSVLFIKYYPDLGRSYHPDVGFWSASYTGVTTSKNLLGMTTLLFGLSFWWLFLQALQRRKDRRRMVLLMVYGISLLAVVWLFRMAQSATALACFVLGAALIAITELTKLGRRTGIRHLLVLAALVVPVVAVFAPFGGGMLGIIGRDATLTGRTDIWRLALDMRGNPLVGTGFESFWLGWRLLKVQNAYRFQLQEAHNGYLEVYLNLGWIGIVLLLGLIITGYRNVQGAFRRKSEIASLLLGFFVVALVYNLTEAGFRTLNPMWIVFLLATLAMPTIAMRPASKAKRVQDRKDQPASDHWAAVGLPQEAR